MADWAVFTGDIVKSTAIPTDDLSRIFVEMTKASEIIAQWQGAPARFTRYRGDGWQMVVAPYLIFRAALVMRAAVRRVGKKYDTRIGIGIGAAHMPQDNLGSADGPAFVASGHALDDMAHSKRMSAPKAPLPLRIALPLADQIIDGWTARQAELAMPLLPPSNPSQEEIATQYDLTRQAVQKQADAMGITQLQEVTHMLEAELMDKQP